MKRLSTVRISLALAMLALMTGCRDSGPLPPAMADAEGSISITLHLPAGDTGSITRALPAGGEDGDGREDALLAENTLTDANIFFFGIPKGETSTLNPTLTLPDEIATCGVYVKGLSAVTLSPDTDPLDKKFTIDIPLSTTGLEATGVLEAEEIGFVTILNPGRDLSSEIDNLKELREFTDFGSAWRKDARGCRDFLMATAYDAAADGTVTIDGKRRYVGSNRLNAALPSDENPDIRWTGEATVQRMAARIDLMYTGANEGSGELVYLTPAGNKVHLTNVLPVNFMQSPSYLMAMTTADIPSEWTSAKIGAPIWGGVQTVTPAGSPANYVIDPFTLAKAAGSASPSALYGPTAASATLTAIADADNGPLTDYAAARLQQAESNGCDRVAIIGYANENTLAPACYTSSFITGLAFRALFQPATIMTRDGDAFILTPMTDSEWLALTDKTLWRYQPSAGDVLDGNALCFRSEADALEYRKAHPEEQGIITKFTDGVCYYNLWLRHYGDDSYKESAEAIKESRPMEYAIVRNNIYRVAVSFSGPGDPEPTLREPETMMARIFVRKWNQRKEETPMQF